MKSSWKVGIDFGASNVKLVCLQKEEKAYQLVAHGFFKRKHLNELTESLKENHFSHLPIRVNLEDPTIKIRKIEIPLVPKEELPVMIQWSLKDVLGSEVEDYIVRWLELPKEDSQDKQSYLVFAVRRSSLKNYLGFLKSVGVTNPEIVEPNVSALLLAFQQNYQLAPEERVVLIDLGSTFTHFAVTTESGVLFSRPLGGMAGELLTKQISRNLGIEEERAEELKVNYKESAVSSAEEAIKLKNTIQHFYSRAAIEIQRSLDAFHQQFTLGEVAKIYLTGGGSQLDGLLLFLNSALNLPTEALNPMARVNTGHFAPDVLKGKISYYALALGLALE